MIIGIDHGYGFMKTKNSVFMSGVARFDTQPPLMSNVLEYNGKYYQVGCAPDGVAGDKTTNDDYYILTLAAIAEELKAAKCNYGDIKLAVGVPLTRYGIEKAPLEKYLTSNKDIKFKYENTSYNITSISKVYTFPQGYAAIIPFISDIKGSCFLVDIGTRTTDILPLTSEHKVDLKRAKTIEIGVTNCISMVNEAISRHYSIELSTNDIIDILRGKEVVIRKDVIEVAISAIEEWCDTILGYLRQNKINYDFTQTYFAGGGAGILNRYAKHIDKDNGCIQFITDIKANAIGFEMLARASEKRANQNDNK